VRIGFADALKSLAFAINPIIETYNFPKHPATLRGIVGLMGWEKAKNNPEVRRLLQQLGTRAREFLGEDVWVNALEKQVLEVAPAPVVIPDLRFPNEEAWVRRHGGFIIKVTRPGFDNGVGLDHESESRVFDIAEDFSIVNNGSLADLHLEAKKLVDRVGSTLHPYSEYEGLA
jgi:hypothetical protein